MDVITPALRVSSILRRTRPEVMMPSANNSQNALRISDWTRNIKIDLFGFRNESAFYKGITFHGPCIPRRISPVRPCGPDSQGMRGMLAGRPRQFVRHGEGPAAR